MADLIRKNNINTNGLVNERNPGQSAQEYSELNSGIYHTNLNEPVITYNQAESEKIIQQKNAIIIMGRDRPMGVTSGYGAQANMGNSACIDIIAGPTGVQAKEVIDEAELSGISPDRKRRVKVTTDKDPSRDAARIYISQRADIDEPGWFNLPDGTIGSQKTRSAIALKADAIRIVSRDGGIKLIAGGRDIKNAQGVVTTWAQGINLIGGDGSTPCQPMVKGDNLRECLIDVHNCMKDMFGMIQILQKAMIGFHGNFATHTHTMAPPPAVGVILPSPSAALMGWQDHIKLIVKGGLLAYNLGRHKAQYLTPIAGEKKYINSFRNHVN